MDQTFNEALQKLGIENYSDRIFNSNSHGELLHLQQYFVLAETIEDASWFAEWFAEWFEDIVKQAEKKWERPESVFQHISKLLINQIEMMNNNQTI